MRRSLAILLIGLVIPCGCGGDDEAGIPDARATIDARVTPTPDAAPPDATPPFDVTAMCNPDNGLFVDWLGGLFDCYPEFELLLGIARPDRATLSTICLSMLGPFVEDGSVVLDDSHLADCLAYLADMDCMTASFDGPNPCKELIQGTVEDGGDCDDSLQCAGDAYCDQSGGGDCGSCTARLGDDADCTYGDQCSGGRCSGDDTPPGTCRSFGQVGDDCVFNEDCIGHLRCDPFVTGKCYQPPDWHAGDDCTSVEDECGFPFSDLICDTGYTGATDKCVHYLDLGDPCAEVWQCDFKRYETCDNGTGGTDTCILPTVVPVGSPCGWFSGHKCQHDMTCSSPAQDGVCIEIPAIGDSCLTDDDCGLLQNCVDDRCQYGAFSGLCSPASE